MANNDNNDLSPRNRSNNNRNMRSSKANANNETADILKDLDFSAKKVEEVQRKKLDGEKKITAEKQKQNKEDDKQLKSQNQQANMIKNFQRTQDQIIKSQYNQTEILKNIAILMDNSKKSMEDELKHQRELLKEQKEKNSAMQDYYDKLNKNYDEQKSYEKQLSEMAKSHADFRGQELKKLQSHQIGLWKQQQKNLKDQQDLQQAINSGYMKSTDEIKRRFTELKDIQEDIAKEQEETAKRIERSKALADKRAGLNDRAFKGLGFNTDSDIFKFFSQRKTASSEDKKFLAASAKLELASTAIETATKAITKFATLWIDRFTSGMDRIVGVYEDTYSQVAAVTGIDEQAYAKWQKDTAKLLMDNGVNNAVTISEAMTDVARLTKDGFTDMNKTSEMAIQNIQNRIINPFVDTTTDAYENLQMQFGQGFTKPLTAVQGLLKDNFKDTRVFGKSINTIIEKLEPVALNARADYVSKYGGGLTAGLQEMVDKKQITLAQALEASYTALNATNDWYSALESDNLGIKVGAATLSANEISDPTKWVEKMYGVADDLFGSTTDPRLRSVGLHSTGMTNVLGQYQQAGDLAETFMDGVRKFNSGDTSLDKKYQEAITKFTNGDLTTNSQEKANIAENAATWLATFKEQYPDWYSFLETITKAVGSILTAIVGGHLFSGATNLLGGIGKGGGLLKGLGSAGTYIGSGLANGFSNAAPTAFGAGKIGALTGTAGAVAGAAGALAGGAMAVKGTTDVVKDFKSGNVNAGTAMSATGAVGGAVGATALLALGASNPVGWVALAIGGAALLGRKLYDLATETGDISDELKKQSKETVDSYKKQNDQQVDNLYELKDQLKKETDLDKQKQTLISAGIATEEELSDSKYDSKEALIALTDTYISETKKLNGETENLLSELEDKQNNQQNNISTGMFGILKKSYKDMSDEDKESAKDFGKKYYQYISSLAESGDKDAKWRLEQWDKMGVNLSDDNFSKQDLEAIMKKGDNKTNQRLVKQFFTDSDRVHSLTTYDSVQKSLGLDSSFTRVDYSSALAKVQQALQTTSKDSATQLLESAKSMGLTYDLLNDDLKNELKEKWSIESYRTGSNYIGYDQIAQLHKGESVITAQTTSDLKEFLGTEDIKDANVTSISESVSSGLSSFSSVIADQTRALVNKIDEVIYTIKSNGTGVYTSKITDAEREEFAL